MKEIGPPGGISGQFLTGASDSKKTGDARFSQHLHAAGGSLAVVSPSSYEGKVFAAAVDVVNQALTRHDLTPLIDQAARKIDQTGTLPHFSPTLG